MSTFVKYKFIDVIRMSKSTKHIYSIKIRLRNYYIHKLNKSRNTTIPTAKTIEYRSSDSKDDT